MKTNINPVNTNQGSTSSNVSITFLRTERNGVKQSLLKRSG